MDHKRHLRFVVTLFAFAFIFTLIPAEVRAESCDEAIFNYYDGLLKLMDQNRTATTKIDGLIKQAKKSAKKYKTQSSQLKRFNSDGIWDANEKKKVLKMEKKHTALKEYYSDIRRTTKAIIKASKKVDSLGEAVESNCP